MRTCESGSTSRSTLPGRWGCPPSTTFFWSWRSPAETRGRSSRPSSSPTESARSKTSSPAMKLPGIVTNITAFGAFVDIGVHQDGLGPHQPIGRPLCEGSQRGGEGAPAGGGDGIGSGHPPPAYRLDAAKELRWRRAKELARPAASPGQDRVAQTQGVARARAA